MLQVLAADLAHFEAILNDMGKPRDRLVFKADGTACGGAFCALAVFSQQPTVIVKLDLTEEPEGFDSAFHGAIAIAGHKID